MYSSPEYNNNLTSSYNDYNTPSKYNTLFAKKLPPTVPSMNFPVILEQSNIYGYDALTHDSDGTTYYDVSSAYGKSCNPNYYVAKCPNNKFIRSFLNGSEGVVTPSACPINNELVSEGYAASPDMMNQIKNLNLVFYFDKNCDFSKKTYQAFVSAIGADNFNKFVLLKDIADANNEQELTNFGGYAVPFLVSRATNNTVTGYMPLQQIISTLSQQNASQDVEMIQKLGLVVYTMDNCMYCNKLKELLQDYATFITYKNGLSPENQKEVSNVQGFPYIVSTLTGKNMTGLPTSVQQLINTLK
jgi:glutaredoxin